MKKNNVFGLHNIPRKLKQCDAFMLGKNSKQLFDDSTCRACRNLGLTYSNLCGPVFVLFTNRNQHMMNLFYHIGMCWVCYQPKKLS